VVARSAITLTKEKKMKFEFNKEKDKGEVVACLMLFDGGPKLCLAIRTADPNKFVWMYEDGDILVQSVPIKPRDSDVVRTFYRGDKITITF
jgi:hypothetical protein